MSRTAPTTEGKFRKEDICCYVPHFTPIVIQLDSLHEHNETKNPSELSYV